MTARATSRLAASLFLALALCGCRGTERSASFKEFGYDTSYSGPRYELTVGRFSNNSSYLRGAFTGGPDRLGNRARELLRAHLADTNRFHLSEPDPEEVEMGFVVTGQVRELGASTSAGTHGAVHGAVTLNVVDARTSRVVFSANGEATSELSADEAEAFHAAADYDEAVSGRVLDQALGRAVGNLVAGLERGEWRF